MSRRELCDRWSYAEFLQAHDTLDFFDEVEANARAESESRAEMRRRGWR